MRTLTIILIVVAAVLALLLIVGLLSVYFIYFFSMKFDRENPKPDLLMGKDLPDFIRATDAVTARIKDAYPHEEVSVKSDEGLALYGDLYLNRNPTDKTVICVHGYNSCGYNDFSPMVEPILKHGCNCLLIDQRHYGRSGGRFTGFGILESKDLLKWIALVNDMFPGGKIVLYGISMGAATVMQACALDLPETVAGIVEDCGFTSPRAEFAAVLKNIAHLPSFPLLNILAVLSKALLGLDIGSDSRKCVAAAKIPMLFVHGNADAFIPVSMCKECYDACAGEKEIVIYEGAGHGQSHFKHPERYENDFFSFINRVTGADTMA